MRLIWCLCFNIRQLALKAVSTLLQAVPPISGPVSFTHAGVPEQCVVLQLYSWHFCLTLHLILAVVAAVQFWPHLKKNVFLDSR